MAIATTNFPTYDDFIGFLTSQIGSVTELVGDLDELDPEMFLQQFDGLFAEADITTQTPTTIAGTLEGGEFIATGSFAKPPYTIKSVTVTAGGELGLQLKMTGALKFDGESATSVTGSISSLSIVGLGQSFDFKGKIDVTKATASITSLSLESEEESYLLKGKLTVDANTGELKGTISDIKLDNGEYAASLSKLKLPATNLLMMSEEDVLPLLLSGNDTIMATGTESVELSGFDGKDVIKGAAGDDWISGGLGKDKLTGGLGADEFVFDTEPNTKTNADIITDFSVEDGDYLVLSDEIFVETDFEVVNKLKDKVTLDSDGTEEFDSASYVGLVYEQSTGKLYYDANENGAGQLVVTLTGKPELTFDEVFIVPVW